MPNRTATLPSSPAKCTSVANRRSAPPTLPTSGAGWSPEHDFKWGWLQSKMLEQGYTPRSLAATVGVSNNTIYEWLTGVKLPLRRTNVITLAGVLGVEVSELLSTMPLD